jgi:hypothetical protein
MFLAGRRRATISGRPERPTPEAALHLSDARLLLNLSEQSRLLLRSGDYSR